MLQNNLLIVGTLLTAVCAFIALAAFILRIFELLKQMQKEHRLEKDFGSELFGQETIRRSTLYYVEPNCCAVDPSYEEEPSLVVSAEQNLFDVVDKFLLTENKIRKSSRHLLLLADSGMGKTSFLINYYDRNRTLRKKKQHRIVLVPLGIPNYEQFIRKIKNKSSTVLFLDAFDEDPYFSFESDYRPHIIALMQDCQQFKRIVLTCRTQFFSKDDEIPNKTGILEIGPRKVDEKAELEFWRLYLAPMRNEQVKKFLWKYYRFCWWKRKKAFDLVKKIPLLRVRPMLLAHIPDLVNISDLKFDYSFQLYKLMVDKWFERESRWIPNKEDLANFSKRLSMDLHLNKQKRGAEFIPFVELEKLAKKWNIPIKTLHLRSRSLLNRDAYGNYKFAHRSIMEYLFVQHFIELPSELRPNTFWTDQMVSFLIEIIQHNNGSKSLNLQKVDLTGANLKAIKLPKSNLKNSELTRASCKKADFSEANFSGSMMREANFTKANFTKAILVKSILYQSKCESSMMKLVNLKDANISNANFDFVNLESANLQGANLEGANLRSANLKGANLRNANLKNACLDNSILESASLVNADCRNTIMNSTKLKKGNLKNVNFENAVLRYSNLSEANIENADFRETDLRECNFTNVKGLNFHLINIAKTLFNCSGINTNILDKIEQNKPLLMVDYFDLEKLNKPKTIDELIERIEKKDLDSYFRKDFVKKHSKIIKIATGQFSHVAQTSDLSKKVLNLMHANSNSLLAKEDISQLCSCTEEDLCKALKELEEYEFVEFKKYDGSKLWKVCTAGKALLILDKQ